MLPLYTGPQVTVCIGSTSQEFKFPKALLCKQSPYFAATFNGKFKEGKEQSTTLEEINGVVSTQSFQMLAQWICLGRVVFSAPKSQESQESISAAIEFARLADMCGVTGMNSMIAAHIKQVIMADADPRHLKATSKRNHRANTFCITPQHIISAANLSVGHPVRKMLANSAVEECLYTREFKFIKESREVPGFATDLLQAVKITLDTMVFESGGAKIKEPISGMMLRLGVS